MRLTPAARAFQSPRAVSTPPWMTPRLGVELAAGAVALGLIAAAWTPWDAARPSVRQTPPQSSASRLVPPRTEDPVASQFMESVALAHLGPLRPETDITAPLSPPPLVAMAAKRVAAPREKRAEGKAADPLKPQSISRPALPSKAGAPAAAKSEPAADMAKAGGANPPATSAAGRLLANVPIVSSVVDKLPSGHDILDGAGTLRRKLTDLVSW